MITRKGFGTMPDGREVSLFVLEGRRMTACVTDLGACLQSIAVPDATGAMADVLLGYDSAEGYLANPAFLGATVGPWANRVAGAAIDIDGTTYHMAANEGANNNHTDAERGLHKRLWDARVEGDGVVMTCRVADGAYGLPGNLLVEASFEVAGDRLRIRYRATSDARTYVNMTSHSYFNLAGAGTGSAMGQELQIFASSYLPDDDGSIPTGELRPVAATPFDFREPKPLGRDIDAPDEQLEQGNGYDRCFCLDGYDGRGTLARACRASDPASGRVLDVWTDQPGMLLYTGNFLGGIEGVGGAYADRSGFALECQHYPDAPHHGNFPQSWCGPGEDYVSRIEFDFSATR
ncbi:MAG: galactose mutarotase [Atopobiaceae bacterium]|jgi:aldose 1-epimerase|nr:galactose mutarotase [Atopobiaceae bacterium]